MKRIFFLTVLAGLLGIASNAQNTSENNNHIKSVKAISTVCGQGRTVSTVIIEYDAPIRNRSLSTSSYQVQEGEIIKVYSNSVPDTSSVGQDGPYVVIELKAETDLTASPKKSHIETPEERAERDRKQGGPGLKAGWSTGGNDIYPGSAAVTQAADIKTVKGKIYKALETPVASTEESCPLVDSFSQHKFISPFTGQVLPYNLYLPEDYDPSISYPLVLFIHDAGAVGTDVKQTLVQGRGAVTWADPDNQARNRCIVVAPQYPFVTVDDVWNYSHHLDATVELLKDLQKRYSIDENRIYTTGQSMGCMSSIVLMLKEPDLFAGALLVAGKWNPDLMGSLARQNIWIISCEGDAHSMELQSKAVALWRQNGYEVAEAEMEMDASNEEMENLVTEMLKEDTHLMFTRFNGGNHRATWYVAYDIEGIQDWLFEQRRPSHIETLAQPTAKTDLSRI